MSLVMDHNKRNVDLKKIIDHKLKVEAALPAEGRTSLYNPLLQKPVSLEPVGPGSYPSGLGGYAYIGPPADFGGSYGCYVDSSGRKQYGVQSSKQFSIYDGSPVQLHSELSAEEREALLSQMDDIHEEAKCESCRAELSISAPIQAEKVHCPYCSSEMSSAVEKVKQCYSKLEEKTMQKDKETVKAEADIAKEAMKVEAPKDANEAVKAPKAADMVDPSIEKDAKNVEVMKEVTEPKETKVKSSSDEEKAQVEAAAQKRRERLEAARKAFNEKKKAAALASLKKRKEAAKAKPVKAGAETKKQEELKKELRIMATLKPEKFAELKKNPRLAAVCAEIEAKLYSKEERKQVRAELALLAQEDPEAHEKAKQELEFIAPEILMEQDEQPAEAPVKKEEAAKQEDEIPANEPAPEKQAEAAKDPEAEGEGEGKKEEAAKKEGEEALPPQDEVAAPAAEAMKTEFLASLESLKAEKIEMSLYGEETANPFWNVVVDAEPVGRIYLQDQENHDQIRAGFTADSYAANFGTAVDQVGLGKMLTLANARLFAHEIDNSETLARVKAKAKAEAKAEFDAQVQTLRQDFLTAVQTAVTASDKNMYKEEAGHSLKGGLFTALANLSIDPQHAIWAIEAGFESAPEYFEFITQKAIEIMDMPTEARSAFADIVSKSGKMEVAASEQPEEDSLRDRLVKASHAAVAMGEVVGGEDKDLIRKNLKLSPNRR